MVPSANDTPGLLQTESRTLKITFEKTSTTSASISWNIPSSAADPCANVATNASGRHST